MAYLIYDSIGVVRNFGIVKKEDAELILRVHHLGGGLRAYEELSDVIHYWYPAGVKTALNEFHLNNIPKKVALGEQVIINNLPEGTKVKLRLLSLGTVGSAGIMKWSPIAKGFYHFTLKKLGYMDKKFIIVAGLNPTFRPAFSVEFV